MVGNSVAKLSERVATSLVGLEMCISKAIPERCLKDIYQLDYFSEDLRQNWTERSKQVFWCRIDIWGGERVVPIGQFWMVGVGIYRWSCLSRSTMVVDLAGVHFDSAEWSAYFEKGQRKRSS